MEPEDMPIQPTGAAGAKGTVELLEAFHPGLKDLEGFSHIILLYHFHRSHSFNLHVVPFLHSMLRWKYGTGWLEEARETASSRKSDDRFK